MRHLTGDRVNFSKIFEQSSRKLSARNNFLVDNDDVNVTLEMPLKKVSIMTEVLSTKRSNLYGKLISDESR